jgi:inner membrane protease ATP23
VTRRSRPIAIRVYSEASAPRPSSKTEFIQSAITIIPKSHIETMSQSSNTNSLPETTTAKSPAAPTLDQDFYTWSTFFNILTGGATPQEREAYFDIKDTINEDRDIARAEKDRKWLLEYSPIVRFLRHNINLLGHDLNETNMRVKRCTTQQSGGFDPDYGILLCANKFRNRGHMEDTMAHEMVHAYDHLRFKLDPLDLRHAACMEVC